MIKIKKLFGILLFVITAALISCDEEADSTESTGFDRGILLQEMADDLIIPNLNSLQTSINNMSNASDDFVQNTSVENLELLREAWLQAVIDFQHCSAFGFGPGSLPLGPFASILGAFPVDEDKVEQNIGDTDFNLAASFDKNVRGFYTVEYLIYGKNKTIEAIISGFNQNRKDYLQLIVNEQQQTIEGIVAEWQANYRDEFINNDGTSAGSPISLLYNDFVSDYENMKNFKVELPAGLTAGQSKADPTLVEAYYSGVSLELIKAHFENSKNIWFGRSRTGSNFTGFEEYLNSVVGGPELVEMTVDSIAVIETAINAIPQGRLSDQIESEEVVTLRNSLQNNTANFKSSMSSLLGISITFNSGDGD